MKKSNKQNLLKRLYSRLLQNRGELFALLIFFSFFLFFRTYQLEERHVFAWDQVDNAWVSKNILVNHIFPLIGMQARQGSGIFIGPLYYYFIAFFYLIFNLDPTASLAASLFTSIISFLVLYCVVRKLFNTKVALIAVFIQSFSFYSITADSIQWPAALIPPISLLVFYFLYKLLTGSTKSLIPLSVILGFSFHIHSTSIFYIIIIFLSLPFVPRKLETLKYSLIAILIFVAFLIPNIIYLFTTKNSTASSFITSSYHGFHLRRFFQLVGDAFIEFPLVTNFNLPILINLAFLPIFSIFYLYKKVNRNRKILIYLVLLWFFIPWFILSVYNGELSEYFFSSTRYIALFMVSYLIFKLWNIRTLIPKVAVIGITIYFLYININSYFNYKSQGLSYYRKKVVEEVKEGKKNAFLYGAPESYLHYIYEKRWQK